LIVLDTNVVYRIMTGQGVIGARARETLDGFNVRRCSAMVQWELAMLADKGRLAFDQPLHIWMEKAGAALWFSETPVTGDIARDAGSLPGSIHGDPCDRIMIATARALMCPLITTNGRILDYAKAGHVQAIDARR
jgi:PIN domain nuclease of toxin-antitoxin system